MSLYDNEIETNPQLNPYRYAQLHPSPEVARLLAEDKAKFEAIRAVESAQLLAKLIQQDRASTGETTLTTDVLHLEQGFPCPEPCTSDEPVNWTKDRRKRL